MAKLDIHRNKIVIVGPPNVGKSTLFNKFSRAYSVVSNYAQTTTESHRKESSFAGGIFEIIDTPGLFSLAAGSTDETVTTGIIINEHPELVLFCGDATNLKRSLVLLAQVLEMQIPTTFCLNKIDEAGRKGISVNQKALEAEVKIPTVLTAAIHGVGLRELEDAVKATVEGISSAGYAPHIEDALKSLRASFPVGNMPAKGILILLLMDDAVANVAVGSRYGNDIMGKAAEIRHKLYQKYSQAGVRQSVFNSREAWADSVVAKTTVKVPLDSKSIGYHMARLSRQPLTGIPILMGVLWLTFYGVGTISAKLAALLDTWIFIPAVKFASGYIANQLLNDFLFGNFGVLTMGVINAIGTVVPILLVFFIIVNFLEEVGYLPNLSVLVNRVMVPFGLSGKAVLPMVLGFGCNTMATVATRMLETKKERVIASFLIALGFPCAVQLGVLFAILSTAPFSALLIVIFAVVATQVVVGVLLNRMIPTKRPADFILELPTFAKPHWRNIAIKTYFRIKWFLAEVLPLFVFASVFMFVLDKVGTLLAIERLLRPMVTGFLSLPDKVTEVFILVLARREIGAVFFKNMVDGGLLDYSQTVVGLVVITLFIPCVSNTMVMVRELGVRWAVSINTAIIVIAIAVGGIVNYGIRLF